MRARMVAATRLKEELIVRLSLHATCWLLMPAFSCKEIDMHKLTVTGSVVVKMGQNNSADRAFSKHCVIAAVFDCSHNGYYVK